MTIIDSSFFLPSFLPSALFVRCVTHGPRIEGNQNRLHPRSSEPSSQLMTPSHLRRKKKRKKGGENPVTVTYYHSTGYLQARLSKCVSGVLHLYPSYIIHFCWRQLCLNGRTSVASARRPPTRPSTGTTLPTPPHPSRPLLLPALPAAVSPPPPPPPCAAAACLRTPARPRGRRTAPRRRTASPRGGTCRTWRSGSHRRCTRERRGHLRKREKKTRFKYRAVRGGAYCHHLRTSTLYRLMHF